MLAPRRTVATVLTALVLLLAAPTAVDAAPPGDTLYPGQALSPGEWLLSADGSHGLTYQADGNLVAYGPRDRPLWSSDTSGRSVGRFELGIDGNAGIVAGDSVVWQTRTWCGAGARLVVQNDGNVVLYCADGRAAFYTGWDRTGLDPGQGLVLGHRITSASGRYHLALQQDGNVVVYGPGGRPVWFSGSYGADSLQLQTDGNLVAYRGSRPAWSSDTWREGRVRFVVQDDGNTVLYRGDGTPAWYSSFDTGRAATAGSGGVRLSRPAPAPAPGPAVAPPASTYYANCTDARRAGAAPIRRGQPGYRSALDRDGDGVACE